MELGFTIFFTDFESSFANKKVDLHRLHHNEGGSEQPKFKTDVMKLRFYWSGRGNLFDEDNPCLVNIHDCL